MAARMKTMLLLALVAVAAPGCGTSGPLAASARDFVIHPLPTMVAQKVPLPLYVVAPPADVPDQFHVDGMRIAIFSVPAVDVRDVRVFVTRDLAAALAPYFASVHVVDGEDKLPKTPHVRADVKLASLTYDRRVSSGDQGMQKNELFGALEWAFGVRASGGNDFAYSFSERTFSRTEMKGFGDTSEFADTFEEALRHLVADFEQKGVRQKLLSDQTAADGVHGDRGDRAKGESRSADAEGAPATTAQ